MGVNKCLKHSAYFIHATVIESTNQVEYWNIWNIPDPSMFFINGQF